MYTHIDDIRIFDGETVLPQRSLTFANGIITAIGESAPHGAEIVDGAGATALPGLIDSHVHTSPEALRLALRFGVTTELEMQGYWTEAQRAQVAADPTSADVRSALLALMAEDGHPNEFVDEDAKKEWSDGSAWRMPSVTTAEDAVRHVDAMVDAGADYIKIMIEEGSVMGHPGLPMIDPEALRAGVRRAHQRACKVIAHALTYEATLQAIAIGVDGLAHLFIDRPIDARMIDAVQEAELFITPCLVVSRSLLGADGSELAADPRVARKLPPVWRETLAGSFGTYPDGDFETALGNVRELHTAGVPILAGTDAGRPVRSHGGVAHGASVHHELQLLAQAGLTAKESLHCATGAPANAFGLTDRGRVAAGLRADFLLVDGDPTLRIDESLSIHSVWRNGHVLDTRLVREF